MNKKGIIAGIAMLVMLLSAFAALPAVPAKAAASTQGTFYLAMQQDLPDFNTWNLGSNSVWKQNVIGWGFESLSGIDYNMLPYPLLADHWTFYDTNLTVFVYLRHNVKFHDGSTMNATDVVFTYHSTYQGSTFSSNLIPAFDTSGDGELDLAEIQAGVQFVDDYTVKFVMTPPGFGQFFKSTLGIPIVPKHIWYPDHMDGDSLNYLWGNDPAASIGTGAFRYKEGVAGSYRIMERFEDYWGKTYETPAGYKLYPPNIDTLYFKIYASIDTAILALQAGDVDYIAWAVTAGRVPSLQSDPNIGLAYLEDNGYFYLAFNEKKQPMNSLPFRQAVSHLIDKDQIVNVYMGGFGSKGSAGLPPFWGEWHNESVEKYPYDSPYDSTTTTSESLLDGAGFIDRNGDGWRDLPDGTPMEKIIILTPPADYDPIRIRAGQAIAKNMRAVGVNAEAKSIDFDTLVATANSMNYQMLTLGWSLGTNPVVSFFDINGPKGSGNTYGFWAADDPNPYYVDLLGVNTLADSESQELAREVGRLQGLANGAFDISDQIKYTRWGEGVAVEGLPLNVLYYKVNVEAYRNTWTGWLPFLGSLLAQGNVNIYGLSNMQRTGAASVGGASASVNAGITLPGDVKVGGTVQGYLVAVDNSGFAVSGAEVAMEVNPAVGTTDTVSVAPATGTTDANGYFAFTVTGVINGYSYVTATVTKGAVSSNDTATINSVTQYPATLYMSVKPQKMVLRPGENTIVDLWVMDGTGSPVAGANLSIDENLVGYGAVNVTYVLTDATGHATMTYTAPATIPEKNAHLQVSLSYSVAKEGYLWVNAASATLVIYNAASPDWTMTSIESVSRTDLSNAVNTTTIVVKVMNETGVAQANHNLTVSYSQPGTVFSPTSNWIVTDGAGLATLSLQLKNMAASNATRVTFANTSAMNSVGAEVSLTFVGTTPPATEIYGGYITYSDPEFMGPLGSLTVTAHIWDSGGVAADGITAGVVVSGTPYGSLVTSDVFAWDASWDYLGISIMSDIDGYVTSASGPFNTTFDFANWQEAWDSEWVYWDWADNVMGGVPVTGGTATFDIYGQDVALPDLVGNIFVLPASMGTVDFVTGNYQIAGNTTISSQYVIGRSYEIVTPTYDVTKPVMLAKTSNYDTTTVNVTVKDKDGVVVPGATATVYENGMTGNANYGVSPASGSTTDSAGKAQATVTAVGRGNVVTAANIKAILYVKASMDGAISTFGQSHVFIYVNHTFLTMQAIPETQEMGSWDLAVRATVTDWAGRALPDMTVQLSSDIGTVVIDSNMSDSNGIAVFKVNAAELQKTKAAYMTLQAKTAGPALELSLASMKVPLQNKVPEVLAAIVAEGGVEVGAGELTFLTGVNLSVEGSVYDSNGLWSVYVTVDGGTAQLVAGPTPYQFGSQARDISRALGSALAVGEHHVKVNATDGLNVSTEVTLAFTVAEPKEEAGTNWALVGGAIAGWAVAAILVAMMLMKRQKGPAAARPEEAAEIKPEEQPKIE
jgi:peptide/nickel transport system substrate-binding protein